MWLWMILNSVYTRNWRLAHKFSSLSWFFWHKCYRNRIKTAPLESKSVVYTLHDIRKCYQKCNNDNYGVNMPIWCHNHWRNTILLRPCLDCIGSVLTYTWWRLTAVGLSVSGEGLFPVAAFLNDGPEWYLSFTGMPGPSPLCELESAAPPLWRNRGGPWWGMQIAQALWMEIRVSWQPWVRTRRGL